MAQYSPGPLLREAAPCHHSLTIDPDVAHAGGQLTRLGPGGGLTNSVEIEHAVFRAGELGTLRIPSASTLQLGTSVSYDRLSQFPDESVGIPAANWNIHCVEKAAAG